MARSTTDGFKALLDEDLDTPEAAADLDLTSLLANVNSRRSTVEVRNRVLEQTKPSKRIEDIPTPKKLAAYLGVTEDGEIKTLDSNSKIISITINK